MKWALSLFHEIAAQLRFLVQLVMPDRSGSPRPFLYGLPFLSFLGAVVVVGVGIVMTAPTPAIRYVPPPDAPTASVPRNVVPAKPVVDLTKPVRDIPSRFPARSRMPKGGEGAVSLSIEHVRFNPERDLVHVYDSRAWWESEHDHGDTEDDHRVHQSLEVPLRRLIELVCREGGTLKIQDAYRDVGIHSTRSLHKQGRAVDLTCDELGLERLAALTWAAGFDWVYYEAPRKGGHHVHASVRP